MILPFLYGCAVSLSPCVLPLIPIVYRVIGEWKGTLSYLLGSAVSYVLLGIMVITVGIHFQIFMQAWYVKLAFSLILLYLAIVSYGPIRIGLTLPQFNVNTKNPFLLGLIAPIICSPCMTPALAAIISTLTVSKLTGIYQLLLFGLGVNMPLILMCFGLKRFLDKIKQGNIGKYVTYFNSILLIGLIVYLWM